MSFSSDCSLSGVQQGESINVFWSWQHMAIASFYQRPPVLWSSTGLQILSEVCRKARPASLAPVHHMCSQAAEQRASCCWTIMLSDDGWLHIRCLHWRAAPSAYPSRKPGLSWWMGEVTGPIRVTPAEFNCHYRAFPSALSWQSHWQVWFTVTKLPFICVISDTFFLRVHHKIKVGDKWPD